jgi:hypothetical protein
MNRAAQSLGRLGGLASAKVKTEAKREAARANGKKAADLAKRKLQMSYNFKAFDAQFPDDAACLDFIFRARYSGHVGECGEAGCIHRLKQRRAYSCAFCGAQIYPTASGGFRGI